MKKKICYLVLALLLSIGVSGCKCNHEWEDATCIIPRICAKCGVAKGTALGHVWVDATCTTPKTCFNCNSIRGTELEHKFDKWMRSGSSLIHTCTYCNYSEKIDYDADMLVNQYVTGTWEGRWILFCQEGNKSTQEIDKKDSKLIISDDGTFVHTSNSIFTEGTKRSGRWTYAEMEIGYKIRLLDSNGNLIGVFVTPVDGTLFWYIDSADAFIFHEKVE